ncbi:hypothetical protein MPNT_50036 [Candidatus Methylacidithermus pantelleriae]|uniref:Uncharacterized protein n=1 Tax=Candidatus Methylacidithermus pantelleriae TaxID=2744239 RepID=A0A8J2FT22_9BACT|nr:hypothetical protein MPNT_50036 [Candidatus Methylacidithermus pantelleriae]
MLFAGGGSDFGRVMLEEASPFSEVNCGEASLGAWVSSWTGGFVTFRSPWLRIGSAKELASLFFPCIFTMRLVFLWGRWV